jgi:hypothetical protein
MARKFTAVACIAILANTAAQAELRSVDMVAPGDGLVTLDTETEFRWLDLTETLHWSINQFQANPPDGFALATVEQVTTLFLDAGLPAPSVVPRPADPEAVARFQSFLGVTFDEFTGYSYSAGLAYDRGASDGVGYLNAAMQDGNRWFTYFDHSNPVLTPDFEIEDGGIWAVQVPEPSACTLVAVGLLSINLASRRRKRSRF